MISITDKRNCTGCRACGNICPVNAISFSEDDEGFIYPAVDEDICIRCGRCDAVCPMKRERDCEKSDRRSSEPVFYAAQLKEKEMLSLVSSGGAFWALAAAVIKENGVVYGAVQRDVDNIRHGRAVTLEEAAAFRRSKYFQSDIGDSYKLVKKDLSDNKTVLFSGTGCQVAGLLGFLGKEYENLITCEVVCHGVPSAKVWKKYREDAERKAESIMTDIVFRDKSKGWSYNQYSVTYENGTVEKERSTLHPFHSGYLQGLFYRPSCGTCPFASLPRCADITLADYWKYDGSLINREADLGISLVGINSYKGQRLFDKAADRMTVEPTDADKAILSCRHLTCHPDENKNRDAFLRDVFSHGYFYAAKKYIPAFQKKSIFVRTVRKLKTHFGHKRK